MLISCPMCNTDSLIQIGVYWGDHGNSKYTQLRCSKCGFSINIQEKYDELLAEVSRIINNRQEENNKKNTKE